MLFEKALIRPPMRRPLAMPNEACLLYIIKGVNEVISPTETELVNEKQAMMMKCDNYFFEMKSADKANTYQAIAVHFYPEVLKKVFENDFPAFLAAYISDIGTLPSWVNMEQIKKGQQVFWDYGREVILALLCRSLPMSYICGNGAKVLTTTTRLIDIPKNPKYLQ